MLRTAQPKVVIGQITKLEIHPSNLEGVQQKEYYLEIQSPEGDFVQEWVPIGPGEEGENVTRKSILDYYLQIVFTQFSETKNFAQHQDVFSYLKDKKIKWVRKPLGEQIKDIPPRLYYVPQRVD